MAHPYWPLFDLEVRTPRLTLRALDDDLERRVLDVALRGVHDPEFMPFTVPWTDLASPEFEHSAYDHFWSKRTVRPDGWNIQLAVIVDGDVVGLSSLGAREFPVRRWFETGSWLGREFHGQGLGTELRLATLHLGFLGFDALMAGTGAFTDNVASLGVTRKLGYQPNGIDHADRRGELGVVEKFRMTREHFDAHVHRDDVELVGADRVRPLLGLE